MDIRRERPVDAVIFDFGGVLANEGFFDGLAEMAHRTGKDTEFVTETAVDIIRGDGYAVHRIDEAEFWRRFRDRTGISGADDALRDELLSRFVLREHMFRRVDKLREAGYKVAILSDQTNWLEELEHRHGFYGKFDVVHNSWLTGYTKKDTEAFTGMLSALGVEPSRTLFVDDHAGHIRRAQALGLRTIHYTDRESFERQFANHCPDLGDA
ncbi:putative hydrolase of the HAD superfamily [Desulfobaculum xiamenense]|uniref:Putative hydrolase of the HAD superfamily n=1 Tax=Desulfobaculum xiamenense TaxID=995050 RepID=A0A846QGA0_9BACT|nr:HAD family phosphatase [Desulfobaculum xiamenense]NJB67328.1 putative hydrolase of the HAD superfamily [Desulfobaculum xiamenense]